MNNLICSCIFIKKSKTGFAIIAVYVDDLNLIGTLEELTRESEQQLLGYADAEYLSDPYKGKSQTWYVFNYNGTAILWRSIKQTIVATSSNHSEILATHEASRECI